MASSYERELRAVLTGDLKGVRAVTRSCTDVARARAMRVIDRPFLVVRAAGSGTAGAGDLLAVRGDLALPIEVKTTAEKRLYLSGRTLEQYEGLRDEGIRCGLMPLYAMRLKGVRGDSWRLLRVETGEVEGPLRSLKRMLPPLPLTSTGRPCLDWDAGMPLHRFLGVVCAPRPAAALDGIRARTGAGDVPATGALAGNEGGVGDGMAAAPVDVVEQVDSAVAAVVTESESVAHEVEDATAAADGGTVVPSPWLSAFRRS